ncbi:hypothetical protein GYA93_22540 [Gordonia desulfuricans]|uniref:Hemophore-related protein n=1 Tax=Gordonia desulfuricans TaxID=89051 RepID=A0A7K3LVP4_9ACTN|nr:MULTISPECIES: hypothetical protein [Gordonia]NDK92314.1 hypothetical protein [Gordonia desulfuricans]WLP92612.1 hypothetical protein Q9K23_10475 [Gordonia sp. NB41Y]
MSTLSRPLVRRCASVLAGTAVAAAGIGLAAGTASADAGPSTPMAGTNCVVAQGERALRAEAPDIYAHIEQYPTSAQGLENVLALSPGDRADDLSIAHPYNDSGLMKFLGVSGWSHDERHAATAAIEQAAADCAAY